MKKLFSLFAVVMMAVISLNLNAITVSAAEPTTYIVKYDAGKEDFVYQVGSTWNDEGIQYREMYYMTLEIKDGDILIVDSLDAPQIPTIELNVSLSNLTLLPNCKCTVTAKSITNCYLLSGAVGIINCDVTNGYVYDYSVGNFNQNCDNVEASYTDASTVSAAVVGKCKSFYAHDASTTMHHVYNFTEPMLFINGDLETDPAAYSTTPSASAPAPAPATPSAPKADEYDDVPKTGGSDAFVWAFGIAAICFAGSFYFKKRA